MSTFSTPTPQQIPASWDLTFSYDIDSTHGGSIFITAEFIAWAEDDYISVQSFIDAVSAASDWTFVEGSRKWVGGTQEITP